MKLDAKAVLTKLTAARIGLTHGVVQDEDTDPNNLLGRPNGYTSRASADLPGGDTTGDKYGIDRGLVIEVIPSAGEADRRSTYDDCGELHAGGYTRTERHGGEDCDGPDGPAREQPEAQAAGCRGV
ncbi:hypothetical protein [Micromonospora sp. NPDC002717]|uniref:hypothetical protein n=1 Tax=Micromonospora sp. NPDC002717 TaxID=3154424 RepID=UPI00331D805A